MGAVGASGAESEYGVSDGGVADIVMMPPRTTALPSFETTVFKCSVHSAKLDVGGNMLLTLQIAPDQKYNAMPLTDAAGIMVEIGARRLRRGGWILDD